MATHGQLSAPSFHSNHALWAESPDNVPPLFDYELYRQSRSRDPSFKFEQTDIAARTSNDQGCLSLASMVNSYYESPHDHMGMHRYRNNAPAFGNPSVGPPPLMTGGGYENPYQKAKQQQQCGGDWNCAPQQSLPQRRHSQRELESGLRENRDLQQHHTPFLTPTIALVHIVILILTMQQNNCPSHTTEACLSPSLHRFAFQPFRENPLLGPSAKTLLSMGALESDLVTKAREGWRIVTAMWLHAGVLHILGTCSGMLLLGMPLERQLGFVKVGVIYGLSGFMGSILSALMIHGRVSVGASGAFMGLLGATLSAMIINWNRYSNRTGTMAGVIVFVVVNTAYGLMPFVDNFMHLGGALMGFLVGNLFLIRPHNFRCWQSSAVYDQDDMPTKRTNAIILDIVWLLSFGVLIAACIMGLYGLFSGKNIDGGCSWCQYLTCAPSRFWKCSGNQHLGCNPSSVSGLLRITCSNDKTFIPDDDAGLSVVLSAIAAADFELPGVRNWACQINVPPGAMLRALMDGERSDGLLLSLFRVPDHFSNCVSAL